jgi:hypothetical protein
MKHIVPVILAVTAILAALTIAIINQSNSLRGYAWAVPYLIALIVVLLVSALMIALINSKQEPGKTNAPSAPPIRQENKQIVSQQQNVYVGGSDPRPSAAEQEKAGHEQLVIETMKKIRPTQYCSIDEIAPNVTLSKREISDALGRLHAKGRVHSTSIDQAPGGKLWMLDDLER